MKKRTLLTLIGGVVSGITGLVFYSPTSASALGTTEFVLHKYKAPTVSISMNQPIVGDNDLEQINGLPVSTSFYKPVEINVSDVKSYYVSVFLDCSALSGNDKTRCEAGNLLTSNGDTLSSVSSAKTFSTMSNEWGFRYNIGSSTQDPKDKYFAPLPTTKANGYIQLDGEEKIKTNSSTHSDSKTLTLGFGAKVNGDTAAGTYNGKVAVAVVTAPSELAFGDIATMQQLDHSICAAAQVHDTVRLRDERDGKYYWITKLEDQHCWMSQNLDLDIYANESDNSVYAGTFDKYEGNSGGTLSSAGVKLTKDNTDITANTLSTTIMPKSTTQDLSVPGSATSTGDDSKHSWDQGLWVVKDPTSNTPSCSSTKGITACTALFVDVSGPEWKAAEDPNFTNLAQNATFTQSGMTKAKTSEAGSPIDEVNHIYDAHYLLGNYYQFNAITAGSATNGNTNIVGTDNLDASDSLCPKGWKLPASNTADDVVGRSSFPYMFNKYGLITGITEGQPNGTLGGKTTHMSLSPLFYIRAGYVWVDQKSLTGPGVQADVWSSRTHTSNVDNVYYLEVRRDANQFWPSFGYSRINGSSARCVLY